MLKLHLNCFMLIILINFVYSQDPNCNITDSSGLCTTCNQDFYISDSGLCVNSSLNCATYIDANTCGSCFDNTTL